MLQPLKQMRVWRFSLYYVVVFGAYVALAAWLPKYYVDVYGQSLSHAALLTALFIFPASLLRPVGGWISDRVGARRVMYATFGVMLVATGILMMPYGYIVIERRTAVTNEILPWTVGVGLFTLLVFIIGCAMGIGKAAVYKHIPEYFPTTWAPSAVWSARSVRSAGSSCRRCSPTPPPGPARRRRPSACCSW
jgi:NNP family nitrate/nitrite transporter-like MFS transporter